MKYTTALILLLFAAPLLAAEEADPAMAVLKRMRDQLRNVMIQQQKTEADRAALAAEKIDLETKNAELTKKLETLTKAAAAERVASEKTIADLKTKNEDQAADMVRLNESLAKWKVGYQDKEDLAKSKEAERAKLADKVVLLDRRVADYKRKNEELYKTGSEVLTRYENFGLGAALAAREPFTRVTRVKMETLVQDYQDKLTDNKIKPEPSEKANGKP